MRSVSTLVDLRSDTVTKPTPDMRAAMAAAEVGDDVYSEDPTVRELEERTADLFGFPVGSTRGTSGALFVPSGVMANQIALRLLVGPGQELLCDSEAHIVTHEDAGLAWHGGIQTRTLPAPRGLLDPDEFARTIRPDEPHIVGTRAVSVEQTHNRGGGTVYPLTVLERIAELARSAGVGVHCDGARIWNAHVASGTSLRDYGAVADTMTVAFSKGLGAPVGSVLLAPPERITEALRMRHRLGGGMRQAGFLAAGALYALDHHVERLAEDHANAASLAAALGSGGLTVSTPETNILLVSVTDSSAVAVKCAHEGVLVSPFGARTLRLVTHLDVDLDACDRAASVVLRAAGLSAARFT
jgi:threonine aldolase